MLTHLQGKVGHDARNSLAQFIWEPPLMVWAHVGLHMAKQKKREHQQPEVNRKPPSCSEPGSDIYRRQRVVSNTAT